jgi:hypothetical protein
MENWPRTLAEVLAPASVEEFLHDRAGKDYYHLSGHFGKFSALITWPDLNRILGSHQLDSPRLRLARDGKVLPPESFISHRLNPHASSTRSTRLRPTELIRHLQEGATLILDAVDEIHEPITDLAQNLERVLCARIQVNLYAGWHTSPGFDVHWDGHDVFILQVTGRKHWKIYPVTREYPLSDDPKGEAPPQNPLWEGMLQDGDLLYIPRGWWHVAIPVDEPTLHLTVGLHYATGMDFAFWYLDRLRAITAIRQDIPRLGTDAEKEIYLQQMHDAWEQAWHPGLLAEYFAELDTRASIRPHFALPWTADSTVLPRADSGWSVKWLVPRPIECNHAGEETIVVRGNGKESTLSAAAWPVLEALEERGQCRIEDLYQLTEGNLTRERLRLFVKELVNIGLVSIA